MALLKNDNFRGITLDTYNKVGSINGTSELLTVTMHKKASMDTELLETLNVYIQENTSISEAYDTLVSLIYEHIKTLSEYEDTEDC